MTIKELLDDKINKGSLFLDNGYIKLKEKILEIFNNVAIDDLKQGYKITAVFFENDYDETAFFGAGMNYRRGLKLIPNKLDTFPLPRYIKSFNKQFYICYFPNEDVNEEMITRFMEKLRDEENLVVNFYTDCWEIIYPPMK